MKKAFLFAPILACSLALAVSTNTRVEVAKADDSGSTTMTLQWILKSVWNGNGEADYGSFKAYVGHGTLSTSGAPGYAAMTKSDSLEGDFVGSGASVDWGGQRLFSDGDDRVQIKFRLSKGMTINVSGLANPEGYMEAGDGSQINYFAEYGGDIINGKYYTALKTVSMAVGTTVSTDIDYQTTLNGGDTFVLEWGRQWPDSRNWSNAGTGVQFSFTPAASIKTLYYSDMVSAVSSAGDDVITDAPFASYGFYHGYLRNHSIEKMTSDAENHLVGGYVQTYHYGATFHNNDSLIVKIVASEHMVLNIQRLEKGTEWLDGCYLRYWVNTTEVMNQKFDSEPDASVFDAYIVLNTNDVFYMEVGFPWDNTRSMNMLNGGDMKTSLPQFNGYGTVNSEFLTNAKDASTTVASAIVCYNGTQNPTLDGYTWDQLGDLYNGLDEKAKALMSQGTYTIENGSAVATNGTSQEVANAVAKYDQLVAKYSYSDFMGRNPQIATGLNLVFMNGDSPTTIAIIIALCATSIALVGFCLIRKRKLAK